MNKLSRKLIKLGFSYEIMYKANLTADCMIKILKLLPNDAKIVNFGRSDVSSMIFLTVESDSYTPVPEAAEIPGAIIYFKNEEPTHIQYGPNSVANHTCNFVSYQGFLKEEQICSICGKIVA